MDTIENKTLRKLKRIKRKMKKSGAPRQAMKKVRGAIRKIKQMLMGE